MTESTDRQSPDWRRARIGALAALTLASCGGRGSRAPAIVVTELRATPTFFAPAGTVQLRPSFASGTARIDPDVGPVRSGETYAVGPKTAAVTYTLTITRDSGVETKTLTVPFRYQERVTEIAPSSIARTRHGAATLADGRILVVGGASSGPLAWVSSETFAGTGGSFALAGDLSAGRYDCTAVALDSGEALVLGGLINSPSFDVATRIEAWDPTARAWSRLANMRCSRIGHTATALNTNVVLIAGGITTGGAPSDRDAEVLVLGFGVRPPNGEMLHLRFAHTATLTASGVLLAGGRDPASTALVSTAERFGQPLELFLDAGNLLRPRASHSAVPLADDRVLLIGGEDDAGAVAPSELYVPLEGRFVAAGDAVLPRIVAPAVRLLDGRVLVVGGTTTTGAATDRIEVWSPTSNAWSEWAQRLPEPRTGHSLHALADGRVVALGGDGGDGFPRPTCYVID